MSYKFNTIVNKNEADTLKDIIFKRVQERSQSMNEDVQADIMDIARDTFISNNNPFSRIIETAASSNESQETPNITAEAKENKNDAGFSAREPKLRQDRIINDQISSTVIKNNMLEARNTLSNKPGFMAALNFLNTQAAISLIKTRADKLEIIE